MIVILTDFGNNDIFTPIMKGVIKTISPHSDIIELSNEVQPQNIDQAAFLLDISYKYFPKKTVFLCVVDPGVGTDRKAIAVETEEYYFVAPDNGLLSNVLKKEKIQNIFEIDKGIYSHSISSTFHGRDIFAPAAAIIDKSKDVSKIGKKSNDDFISIDIDPIEQDNRLLGKIVHIDSFGNAVTNIHYNYLQNRTISSIDLNNNIYYNILNTFSDVKSREPLAYIGSFGYLEFAIRNGDFKKEFSTDFFDEVKIIFDDHS